MLQLVEAFFYLLKLLDAPLYLYGPDERVKDLADHSPVSGVHPPLKNIFSKLPKLGLDGR